MTEHEKNKDGVTISITTGTIFKTVLILVLFYFLFFFRDLVLILLTAVVMASAVEPATKKVSSWGLPRSVAVGFIYISIIAALIGFFFLFVRPIVSDIISIDSTYNLSSYVSESKTSIVQKSVQVSKELSPMNISDTLSSFISDPGSSSSKGAFAFVRTVFGGLFSFILILVFAFYLSVQKHGVKNFLRLVTPDQYEDYVIGLWQRTQHKIGLWMYGQMVLGLIVAVLAYLGLSLMQVPYALSLAFLIAIFEIVPVFGPVLASIPAILIAFTNGTGLFPEPVMAATAVALFYVIIQQFESHLIYPLVIRNVIGVSPILVIIAIVIGVESAGVLGAILAVPIASALVEFTNDIQERKDLLKSNK
jgi:predicted PurR-regulated permease PerM